MTDTVTNSGNVTASAGRDDAITANASPRPWRVDGAFILDSAGGAITMMCEPDYTGDAALIVDAVNERDRLRKAFEDISEFAAGMTSEEDEANAFAILDICAKALEGME